IRVTPQHETDAAFANTLGDVGNTLCKKCVVPQVGVWIERNGREEDHHRLAKDVCGFDGNVERWVAECALRTLHPVDDAAALGVGRTLAADGYAWVVG